jgi:hypothetical protein
MPIASSAATMAPNFKPCMFHSPNDFRVARALGSLRQASGKKNSKELRCTASLVSARACQK